MKRKMVAGARGRAVQHITQVAMNTGKTVKPKKELMVAMKLAPALALKLEPMAAMKLALACKWAPTTMQNKDRMLEDRKPEAMIRTALGTRMKMKTGKPTWQRLPQPNSRPPKQASLQD